MKFLSLLLTALFITASGLATEPPTKLVSCHSHGGGYVVQDLQVHQFGGESIGFDLQRYSPVPEMVPDMGLMVEGKLARQATIQFPASLCLIKSAPAPNGKLIACSTGVSKISAELLLLDGTSTSVALPNNFTIEVHQEDRHSVYASKTGSLLLVSLSSGAESTLGFRLRECKDASRTPR